MTNHDLAAHLNAKVLVKGEQKEIKDYYIGDLLSYVMGNAPSGCCWLTIMSNVNVLAVATLLDCACIVLCDNCMPDEAMLAKAIEHNQCLLSVPKSLFETAVACHQ